MLTGLADTSTADAAAAVGVTPAAARTRLIRARRRLRTMLKAAGIEPAGWEVAR